MKTSVMVRMFTAAFLVLSTGCMSLPQCAEVTVGQHPASFEKEIRVTLRADYLLYLPEQYSTTPKKWPLILFLHGTGERGHDLNKVKMYGPPELIAKENREFRFVVVSPQCPEGESWTGELQIATLNALLDDLVRRYRIDEDRIYVTGLSMGGMGTWLLANAYPHRFAAIAPVSGAGDPESAERLRHLPVWVFHGAHDTVVPLKESLRMVEALKRVGGNVTLTVYPEAGHDSWTATYKNPALYEWFLKHSRSDNEQPHGSMPPNRPDAGEGK